MRLNTRDIQLITLFEGMTGAKVVDFFESDNTLVFLVKAGDAFKAIGKSGETINRVKKKMGRSVLVYEDADSPEKFVRNVFKPFKVDATVGDEITVQMDTRERMDLTSKRLRIIKSVVKNKLGTEAIKIKTSRPDY